MSCENRMIAVSLRTQKVPFLGIAKKFRRCYPIQEFHFLER
ncbi:hypothetical protein LEP1GSC195_2914 [Leptospira wolbachii serovar Codice str. CDC]|uniref:Uncharacterized protein n=1 Tax=Leptospira wolbachii serovar Codice str. CDC TaxID=1218599 RepID=R9A1X8_9LEPT|nr:hypothetical protein LEP1GSC195_2914 [Leptospira wolbachii serovar Codice str. CDC]